MEEKRNMFTGRLLISLVIAIIIFISIFFFIDRVINSKTELIDNQQRNLYFSFMMKQLRSELATSCTQFNIQELSVELDELGAYITILEEKLGKEDSFVIEQKKEYTALEVQHMILSNRESELCNKSKDVILFFYSNKPEHIDSAEESGYMLSTIKRKNSEILIYSLDFDLDFDLMEYMINIYNIKQPNTLLINNEILVNPENIDDISDILDKQKNTVIETGDDIIVLN